MSEEKKEYKSRHIRYLLYEDNEQHLAALERIKNDDIPYIGIRHHIIDIDGQEVLEGEGKPHFHIYQSFEYNRHPSALAKRYGLLDDNGKPSVQFVRCIHRGENATQHYKTWQKALAYLTHLNAPDKELYSDKDVFGWDCLKAEHRAACIAELDKQCDLRTALYAMKDWVENLHAGDIISSSMVIDWLLQTPYLRFRNEKLFTALISEHNQRIWALQNRDRLENYSCGQIELNRRVSGLDYVSDDEWTNLVRSGAIECR